LFENLTVVVEERKLTVLLYAWKMVVALEYVVMHGITAVHFFV
jgi:hypothetical protein